MTNFDKQLKAAIELYASLDGRTFKEIAEKCLKEPESLTAENVKLIMFAAR